MKIAIDGKSVNLPDFLVVGAAKAGTTSLYHFLAQHGSLYMPATKEPRFFSFAHQDHVNLVHPVTGARIEGVVASLQGYLELFAGCPEGRLCGEASTQYLYDGEKAIANMRALYGGRLGDVAIIMVLRNPVERAWSNYVMHRNAGAENLPPEEALAPETCARRMREGWPAGYDYLGYGMYAGQVQAWQRHFPRVLVLLHEDLDADPAGTMRRIFDFLGVPGTVSIDTSTRYNKSGEVKGFWGRILAALIFRPNALKEVAKKLLPQRLRYRLRTAAGQVVYREAHVPPELRRRLVSCYAQDVARLQAALGRDLSAWLKV